MWVPYQMQLAYGWTSLTVIINSIAVTVLIPAILIIVPIYGPIAAAWIWVILNGSYCLIGAHFMYRRILKTEKLAWYIQDVIIPLSAVSAIAFLARLIFPANFERLLGVGLITLTSVVSLVGGALVAPLVRKQTLILVTKYKPF
jgi:hypothetical protein